MQGRETGTTEPTTSHRDRGAPKRRRRRNPYPTRGHGTPSVSRSSPDPRDDDRTHPTHQGPGEERRSSHLCQGTCVLCVQTGDGPQNRALCPMVSVLV